MQWKDRFRLGRFMVHAAAPAAGTPAARVCPAQDANSGAPPLSQVDTAACRRS